MSAREERHLLLDRIPESDVPTTRKFLLSLVDPAERAILTAPEDDEPESAEERAAVEASLADPTPEPPTRQPPETPEQLTPESLSAIIRVPSAASRVLILSGSLREFWRKNRRTRSVKNKECFQG